MNNAQSGKRKAKATSLPTRGKTPKKLREGEPDGQAVYKASDVDSGVEAMRVMAADDADDGIHLPLKVCHGETETDGQDYRSERAPTARATRYIDRQCWPGISFRNRGRAGGRLSHKAQKQERGDHQHDRSAARRDPYNPEH